MSPLAQARAAFFGGMAVVMLAAMLATTDGPTVETRDDLLKTVGLAWGKGVATLPGSVLYARLSNGQRTVKEEGSPQSTGERVRIEYPMRSGTYVGDFVVVPGQSSWPALYVVPALLIALFLFEAFVARQLAYATWDDGGREEAKPAPAGKAKPAAQAPEDAAKGALPVDALDEQQMDEVEKQLKKRDGEYEFKPGGDEEVPDASVDEAFESAGKDATSSGFAQKRAAAMRRKAKRANG